jgi:hypothetical protein
MPWANDGGTEWNSTRCAPIDATRIAPDEACVVEGNGYSGLDNCALATMCWGVDAATNQGVCYAMCSGSEDDPACPGGGECFIGYDGTIALCLDACDPLAPACAAHESCVFSAAADAARCVPTNLVTGLAYAEPCNGAVFECGSGLVCVHEANVPVCADSCCTAACDLAAPAPCPDAAAGQVCVPLYDDPPDGLQNLGYCGLPG